MKYLKLIIVLIIILLKLILISCDKFEYSHHQILHNDDYRDINQKNISRFINTITDTVIIAVIGDSQRFYDATGKIIKKINNIPYINFVIHTGDLVDFGLQKEYIWMHKQLSGINYPYVAVVGNHDLVGNGCEIYKLMYGDYNFSFTFNGSKFIFINTNSREYNFDCNVPNIKWLDNELSDTSNYKNAIIICHGSYLGADFNSKLRDEYISALRKYKKVLLSINGHSHNFNFTAPGSDNISYLTTYSASEEKFIIIKIWNNNFSYKVIN